MENSSGGVRAPDYVVVWERSAEDKARGRAWETSHVILENAWQRLNEAGAVGGLAVLERVATSMGHYVGGALPF